MTIRGLTLPLTLFGTVLFTVVMLAVQVATYIAHLPNIQASLIWIVLLVLGPTVLTGIVSGLTASLGAYVGMRTSSRSDGGPLASVSMSIGAGVGGILGSAAFLLYLSWAYQNGPGPLIALLGSVGVFGAYAGFTALWERRRSRDSRAPQ